MTQKEAKALRSSIEKTAARLDDQTASTVAWMYPRLTASGDLIPAGTRICWDGQIKRAAVAVWDRDDQNPSHAPDLWEDLDYVDGIRKIPDMITSTLAFSMDELGWRDGVVYQSLIAGNVWTPETYPSGWKKIKGETPWTT